MLRKLFYKISDHRLEKSVYFERNKLGKNSKQTDCQTSGLPDSRTHGFQKTTINSR